MQLQNMLRYRMAWAEPSGPYHEVALSSRIRLARNLRAFPFPGRAAPKACAAVLASAFEASGKTRALAKSALVKLEDLDAGDRLFLVERRLISSHLAREPRHRGVAVGDREVLSMMVNEEDHLRLQGIDSGLCLKELHAQVGALDDELSRSLEFAFHPEWGYLAACPTNVGTGLRASVLAHLPGLALTGQINRVLDGLSRLGIVARGLYGEGTQVMGDFYQISNATALGPSEEELVSNIAQVVGSLIQKELEARAQLGAGAQKVRLEDLVWRSLGALMSARLMTFEEAMQHLSYARMALTLGIKIPADMETVNELVVLAQPGHIQMLSGKELPPSDRDFLRATLLRRKFKGKD